MGNQRNSLQDSEWMEEVAQTRYEATAYYRDWNYEGRELWIPVRDGNSVRCRLYEPEKPVADLTPVYFDVHGGGWSIHTCEADQPLCMRLARQLGIRVVTIDYRLMPEVQFPIPICDVIDVIRWFYTHAQQFSLDPLRMGVGGHSAGGHLSASAALYAKEEHLFPLRCLILDYPGIRPVGGYEEEIELQGGELTDYQKGFLEQCVFYGKCVRLSENQLQDYHIMLNLADTKQLHGLPPTLVTACENDLLRFQDMTFATKLMAAGVETSFRLFEGVTHGFAEDQYYTPEGDSCHQLISDTLKRYLLA